MSEQTQGSSDGGAANRRVAIRDDLEGVTPYGAPQWDVKVRLNTNETATPPPADFLDAVTDRVRTARLNRYPDRDHRALRQALAERHGCGAHQVWAANGSNEILLQLLQTYGGPGRHAVVLRPSYSMYPELCRTTATGVVTVDLDEQFRVDVARTVAAAKQHAAQVLLVASPNNPVGSLVAPETIVALHDNTDALVVVDEAYVDFAPGDASVVSLVDGHERLGVVRTFSKAFRLAGLRLGYLVANPWVIDDVQTVRLPYHLDTFKQVAGIVALEREAEFLDHRAEVIAERQRVAVALAALPGVQVLPSAANFLLIRTAVDDLFAQLVDHEVLIRDFSTLARLEGCVRATIGTPDENDALIAAFTTVLTEHAEL